MPIRILVLILLLTTVGCLPEAAQLALVPSDATTQKWATGRPIDRPVAVEEVARRVATVGQKLINGNRALAVRPNFTTLGVPHEELFHRGTDDIYISEGLVKKCKDDDQLAAVLAIELGRMIAAREMAGGTPVGQPLPRLLPQDERVGNDASATFGSPDGTRRMELARLEAAAKKPHVPPEPEALARVYLRRSGFAEGATAHVAHLVQLADTNGTLSQQMPRR